MYYNGTIIRLFPSQMVRVFGKIFSDSYGGNKAFVADADSNEETQQLIENISKVLVDKSFDSFIQKYQ